MEPAVQESAGEVDGARALPRWSLVLAGALIGSLGAAREEPAAGPAPAPPVRSLGTLSARELRALPGIGERRALEIAAARWARAPGDPPLYLQDIPGIGPAVEQGVRAALEALRTPGPAPRGASADSP